MSCEMHVRCTVAKCNSPTSFTRPHSRTLQTDKKMLHFVMADGGFDVTGNENVQVRSAREARVAGLLGLCGSATVQHMPCWERACSAGALASVCAAPRFRIL